MTPASRWKRRAGCAHSVLESSYRNGLPLTDTEPRLAAALVDLEAHPGSLVRAVACYLVGLEMGLREEVARSLACGLEYLHTASLVFDDLPAMDDARVRRGAPCVHVAHGEALAMLAALALVNRGYAMLWQGITTATADRRERAGRWVEARLGPAGVIGGQALDLCGREPARTPHEVSAVAARKTGELLRLVLVLPAIVGRGTAREITVLDRVARLRGLAYQAADDLKDVSSAGDAHGKSAGRDAELGRPNMVAAAGFGATLARFRRLQLLGDRAVATLPGPAERWGMLESLRVAEPC